MLKYIYKYDEDWFMIKIKKYGFTLPEVLITLAIVGALAALVLPGLIKDTQAKAMMSLLQGTVGNLNDAVQTELTRSGATNIKDTLMYSNPKKFLTDSFDVKTECTANANTVCSGPQSYRNLSGGTSGVGKNVPVLLKNGVAIDLIPDCENDDNSILVSIDLNGGKEPNIVGVDLFYLFISGKTDIDNGVHMGDVRGFLQKGIGQDALTVDNATLKTKCISGWGSPCYLLVERSGFDPNYLDNDY